MQKCKSIKNSNALKVSGPQSFRAYNECRYKNVGQALPDNKINCHSKLDLESHHTLLRNNEILNQVQDDKRGGFTLIELLVVVLIIGILAAVALPQYQKAVEKSRAVQALTLLRATYQAAEAYFLANDTWPSSLDQLDVDLPFTGNQNWYSFGWHKQGKANQDWAIQLYEQIFADGMKQTGVVAGRISGPYQGAGFYLLSPSSNYYTNLPTGKPVCVENSVYTDFPFTKTRGDYCSKIMGGTFISTSSATNFFQLP